MASNAKDVYLSGLVNAHALETEAVQLLKRQVERLEDYPEMEARIRHHIEESREQQGRLERILGSHGSSPSSMKDMGLGLVGNLTALAQAPARDEVVKNSFANFAFEHYEIAAYRSLIAMAKAAGDDANVPLLRLSLEEEVAMAGWISDHLEEVSLAYLRRETHGEKAGL